MHWYMYLYIDWWYSYGIINEWMILIHVVEAMGAPLTTTTVRVNVMWIEWSIDHSKLLLDAIVYSYIVRAVEDVGVVRDT